MKKRKEMKRENLQEMIIRMTQNPVSQMTKNTNQADVDQVDVVQADVDQADVVQADADQAKNTTK